MWSMMLEEVAVVRVAVSTTCFRPSLFWMELRIGRRVWLEAGERSMLKSPRRTKDLSLDGGSCSREDSTLESVAASDEGGR